MKNLAIVIAVSEYTSPAASDLPACQKDGEAIARILRADPRFDDILLIEKDTRSSNVKEQVIEFIKKHKSEQIGDLIFYFTGHGNFSGNDFYYLLTDYDARRQNQTSLSNSELDNLIRGLQPALFVKMVDACNSGVTYIKNPEDFRSYLKEASGEFKKLYFMFSSHTDQYSYQDHNLSYFTKRIIEAISQHDASSIRYKDIIDFVSDAFEGDGSQTPFFVTQAEFTETFSNRVSDMREIAHDFLPQSAPALDAEKPAKQQSLVELIKKDAELYCTEEEALARVNAIPSLVQNTSLGDISELYDIHVNPSQEPPPTSSSIGIWLDKNKDPKNYFFTINRDTRDVTRRVPKNRLAALAGLGALQGFADDEYKIVTEQERYVTGYRSTIALPYVCLQLLAEPRFPNLNPAICFIAPVLSKTHLRLFWSFSFYEHIDWNERRRFGKMEWITEEIPLRSDLQIKKTITSVMAKFFSFLEEPIKAKWGDAQLPSTEASQPEL